jgi:hypothetical protein
VADLIFELFPDSVEDQLGVFDFEIDRLIARACCGGHGCLTRKLAMNATNILALGGYQEQGETLLSLGRRWSAGPLEL